jgi:hypothetical protein
MVLPSLLVHYSLSANQTNLQSRDQLPQTETNPLQASRNLNTNARSPPPSWSSLLRCITRSMSPFFQPILPVTYSTRCQRHQLIKPGKISFPKPTPARSVSSKSFVILPHQPVKKQPRLVDLPVNKLSDRQLSHFCSTKI